MVSTPVRTCVGCRERDLRSNLVRVVLDRDTGPVAIVVDWRSDLPGRSAWLHPRHRCVDQATRRRVWARALRYSGSVDVSALRGLDSKPIKPVERPMDTP
jgi:predicted RNA-binding protein YlxR (DUF448 family)